MFVCKVDNCGRQFRRKFDLKQHISQRHAHENELVEKCFLCGQVFMDCQELQEHYEKAHKPSRRFVVKESAFRKDFQTYRLHFLPSEINFDEAQNGIRKKVFGLLQSEAVKRVICKISLIFVAEMIMVDHSGEKIQRASIPFRAPTFIVSSGLTKNIANVIKQSFVKQRMALDEFMRSGSNWQFDRALAFDIEVSTVKPVRGGRLDISCFTNSKWLYSPPNKNNKCLLYCLAYFVLFGTLVKHNLTVLEELSIKKQSKKFVTKGIKFPSAVDDVRKFVDKNPQLNLKVNILYRDQDEKVYPLEFGVGNGTRICNLLIVPTKSGYHYLAIKNVDQYLKKVYNQGRDKRLSYQKIFFCLNCLSSFRTESARDKHLENCSLNRAVLEKVPEENEKTLKFKHFENQHPIEMVAYLDFECVLPSLEDKCELCRSLKCKCDVSFVKNINMQVPVTYSFVVLGQNDEIVHERTMSCPDAHIDFVAHLLEQEKVWIKTLLETSNPIEFTKKNQLDFDAADKCYMCGIAFDKDNVKCKDHSHASSKYLGAACQACNLRRRRPKKLKIFVHNCSKYDMHFIIKAMALFKTEIHGICVLPYNGENFRTLRFNSFEFIDTLAFLQAPLATLSEELKLTDHNYHILKQTFLAKPSNKSSISKKRMCMVLSKSFFPYEFCTSMEQMLATKKLPARKNFYSSLSEEKISKADHEFAKSVWKEFKCKNLLDYAEIYCKIDTILLAEIFQSFRKKMHAFSGIDPAYYISLPAYGYDSMLKITGAEIELPTDIDMVHFLERCKRGGVSFINTRYLFSTNVNNGDIIYIDRNNLYGEAQMSLLPYQDFKWLTPQEVADFDIMQNLDGPLGFIIECDLSYPKELHIDHSNLPLAPEVLEVKFDNLSPYAKNALSQTEGKANYKDIKLMTTFHDRVNYVTHAKNLQLYIKLGMKLLAKHRILSFKQERIFQPYIEKTTAARQKAASKFEMDMFKKLVSQFLLTLSVFKVIQFKCFLYTLSVFKVIQPA